MKITTREDRTFPAYLFGGRLRTSTLALIVAFAAIWWLYETYEPAAEPPPQIPASEVVPPGFIPDPAYTWAPRTNFQRPTTTSTTTTPPTTTTTTPETTTTTTAPSVEGTPPPATSGEPTSPTTTPVPPPPPGPAPATPTPPSGPPPPAPPPGA